MSKDEDKVRPEYIYAEETQIKYWKSSLFNDVYLRQDLPNHPDYKHEWENDDTEEFQYFLNTLYDLAHEYGTDDKILSKWSETETINNWIKPVLVALGWANKCTGAQQNPFLEETSFSYEGKTYRTDILLVDMPKEKQYIRGKKGNDKLIEARENILIPVEAKYWDRLEQFRQEKKEQKNRSNGKQDDISNLVSPNDQILRYMEILKKDWGILTDGSTWRLLNREISGEDSERYFEFNLSYLIKVMLTETNDQGRKEAWDSAKFFYFLFRKSSFYPEESSNRPLVDEILKYSKKYVNTVEEDLKQRFVKAMNYSCNGLNEVLKKSKMKIELSAIRSICESALFNILFTKSLESRNVLPMNAPDYKKISLSSIIDKIEQYDPEKDIEVNVSKLNRTFNRGNGNSFEFAADGTELHDRIARLTKVIHDGRIKKDDFGFEIKGFRESIFSDEEWKIFRDCRLLNYAWVQVLFELGYAESDIKGRKYQQIPYSFFTPRQLGSIYESFLEFQIDEAQGDMVYEKGQWKPANLKSIKYQNTKLPVVHKGELFFTPDNKERKATGSYYTPDYIVQYIVKETIGNLEDLNSNQVLEYKVCDPAMGSGHFLVAALRHLNSIYMEKLSKESDGDLKISLAEAKRKVLDSCIFGVDFNSRAVKLAKLSLWLESAHINYKLERLDDQLKVGDSLVDDLPNYEFNFDWSEKFGGHLDAIVSNPPWISVLGKFKARELSESYSKHIIEKYGLDTNRPNVFEAFIRRSLQLIEAKPGARFGTIVPEAFGKNRQYAELRRKIVENLRIEKIVYGFDFPGITMPTGVFVISNFNPSNTFLGGWYPEREKAHQISDILQDDMFVFRVSDLSVFPSVSGFKQLVKEGFCDSFTGVIAGKGKVTKEKEVGQVAILKGRDIKPFKVCGSHFIKLEKESFVGGTQKIDILKSKPKVLIRKTGDRIIACLEENGMPIEQSLYGLRNIHGINPKALVCFLNSDFASTYYMDRLVTNRSTTPQLKKMHLDSFPVPIAALNVFESELVKLHDEIDKNGFEENLEKRLNNLIEKILNHQKGQAEVA